MFFNFEKVFWVASGVKFLALLCCSFSVEAEELPRGWMWYEDPIKLEKPPHPEEPESPQKVLDVEALTPAEQRSRALGRQFEAQIAISLESPNFENVQKAQHLQRAIINRADRFQKLWQQVSLLDPESYQADENPNTAYRTLQKRLKSKNLDTKIKALAKEWGLFFLFKEGCPYCDTFAPHVKQLERTYGFEVKAITADRGKLALYPNASLDNGAMAALNPRGVYPALLLAHPSSGAVIPVSWGLTSYSQILDNFEIILSTLEAS